MKEKETKKELHSFMLTDYEKEEAYLRKMANKGWRFLQSAGITYTFEKMEPEDIIYLLDFHPLKKTDREKYLHFYRKNGWTYLQDTNDVTYFCKRASGNDSDRLDLFKNDQDKLEVLGKLFKSRMLPLSIIALFIIFIGLVQFVFIYPADHGGTYPIAAMVIWLLILIYWVYVLIHCSIGFAKLKRKYSLH